MAGPAPPGIRAGAGPDRAEVADEGIQVLTRSRQHEHRARLPQPLDGEDAGGDADERDARRGRGKVVGGGVADDHVRLPGQRRGRRGGHLGAGPGAAAEEGVLPVEVAEVEAGAETSPRARASELPVRRAFVQPCSATAASASRAPGTSSRRSVRAVPLQRPARRAARATESCRSGERPYSASRSAMIWPSTLPCSAGGLAGCGADAFGGECLPEPLTVRPAEVVAGASLTVASTGFRACGARYDDGHEYELQLSSPAAGTRSTSGTPTSPPTARSPPRSPCRRTRPRASPRSGCAAVRTTSPAATARAAPGTASGSPCCRPATDRGGAAPTTGR